MVHAVREILPDGMPVRFKLPRVKFVLTPEIEICADNGHQDKSG
jgi:hypothetical protein